MFEAYDEVGNDLPSDGRMLEVILERILVLTHTAQRAIDAREFERAHNDLIRAQFALGILEHTVDPRLTADLYQSLKQLYRYLADLLGEANLYKKTDSFEVVRQILHNLIDGVTQRRMKDDPT